MSKHLIQNETFVRKVDTPEGTAVIINKFKDLNLEVNIYEMKKGNNFFLNPPKNSGAIKTYWLLSGEIDCRNARKHCFPGDMIVLKTGDDVYQVTAVEETKILVHSLNDNSFDQTEENFRYIYSILKQIQDKDAYTYDHSNNVYNWVRKMAVALEYDGQRYFDIMMASKYHDVGKIFIPDEILNKPSGLTQDEYTVMKTHVLKAEDLLCQFFDRKVFEIAILHHERIDGSGYPKGLKGEEISQEGRILAICDSYDAMTSDRVYKVGKSKEKAIIELRALAGTLYDPELVETFIKIIE